MEKGSALMTRAYSTVQSNMQFMVVTITDQWRLYRTILPSPILYCTVALMRLSLSKKQNYTLVRN